MTTVTIMLYTIRGRFKAVGHKNASTRKQPNSDKTLSPFGNAPPFSSQHTTHFVRVYLDWNKEDISSKSNLDGPVKCTLDSSFCALDALYLFRSPLSQIVFAPRAIATRRRYTKAACRHLHLQDTTMPKASKPGYYAVRIGRVPGIYLSWYAQK